MMEMVAMLVRNYLTMLIPGLLAFWTSIALGERSVSKQLALVHVSSGALWEGLAFPILVRPPAHRQCSEAPCHDLHEHMLGVLLLVGAHVLDLAKIPAGVPDPLAEHASP